MKSPLVPWLIGLPLLLGGCASVASFRGITLDENSVYVSGLPPIRQNEHYSCGAACVAAVAAFWNVPLHEFRERHPQLPGDMTGADLQMLAKELGLQAFAYRGSMDDLEENLRKGRPVIVMIPQPLLPSGDFVSSLLLNAWDKWGSKPAHWVVVIGMAENQSIILQDPASGPLRIKREIFQEWWTHDDNLTVLLAAH